MCYEDILSQRERLFDSSFFLLKIFYKLAKVYFLSKKYCQRRRWRGGFLSEKNWFSLDYPRGHFPQKNIGQVDYYCFLFIVFEILVLLVCPGLMLCKKLSFAKFTKFVIIQIFVCWHYYYFYHYFFFFWTSPHCHPLFRFSNTPPT